MEPLLYPQTTAVQDKESLPESVEALTPTSTEEQEFELSPLVQVLQLFPSWFPKGPFTQRFKKEIEEYNKKCGFTRMKYFQVNGLPEGFTRLAAFQNSDNNFAVFRRFGELSARVLIQLQIDLTDLEKQQHELDEKDAADPTMQHRLRGYENFKGWNTDQRVLISKIQAKLDEYFNLLLKDSQVRALGAAPARHHIGLFNWMWNHKPLGEDRDSFIFHAEDFVSVASQSGKGGRLADFVEAYLHRWPNSHIKKLLQTERELTRTNDPYTDSYAPGRLAILTKALSLALAVSFLFVPILVLFLVPLSKEGMAWLVFGFVVAFGITLTIVTEAKTQDILFGTAAYAAVIATFLGNINQGSGFRSG